MNIEEQLKKGASISMSAQEKADIRAVLVSHIDSNPLLNQKEGNSVRSPYNIFSTFNSFILKPQYSMLTALFIAVLIGGGTSFAAEGTLPGDFLYPVKVNINENIQEITALSDVAKVNVQTNLATRRLEEAEKLAVSGNLTPSVSSELKTNFEKHVIASKKSISKIEKEGDLSTAALVSSDFQVALEAHSRVINEIPDNSPIKDLSGTLAVNIEEISSTRDRFESQIYGAFGVDTKPALEHALASVEKETKTSKNTITSSTPRVATMFASTETDPVSLSKTALDAGDYKEAFAQLKKAEREAKTEKLVASTQKELNIWTKKGDDRDLVVCPAMAKQCPDGSYVGATGPNCEYVCGGNTEPGDVIAEEPKPIATTPPSVGGGNTGIACPAIARVCSDGSYGEQGPNCEIKCPGDVVTAPPVEPKPITGSGCVVGGCSGQLCSESSGENGGGLVSTCEWREEYGCYRNARCEKQQNGQCGWTQTTTLLSCLKNPEERE